MLLSLKFYYWKTENGATFYFYMCDVYSIRNVTISTKTLKANINFNLPKNLTSLKFYYWKAEKDATPYFYMCDVYSIFIAII